MRKYLYISIFIILFSTTPVMANTTDKDSNITTEITGDITETEKAVTDKIQVDIDDTDTDVDVDTIDIENIDDDSKDTPVKEEEELDSHIIKITAGLTKEKEVTFDKVRNISGEGKEGTKLIFNVYQDKEDKEDVKSYSQSIGSSGLFSQLIDLKEGKNYIEIIIEFKDKKKTLIFQIDRKKEEIKKEIQDFKINNILSKEDDDSKDKVLESLLN